MRRGRGLFTYRFERTGRCHRRRSLASSASATTGGATLDDRGTNSFLDGAWRLCLLEVPLHAVDHLRAYGAHVIADVRHAHGLEQGDEALVVHAQIASHL